MRPLSILALLILSLWLLPVSHISVRGTATVYVTVYDYGFLPKNENITTGTTIVWNNTGGQGHTIFSSGSPSFQSSSYTVEPYGQPGQHTYSIFFGQPGVYHYYCSIHPSMTGALNVTGPPVNLPPGGGNGQPPGNPSPTSTVSDYLIPVSVAVVLAMGGVSFYAWRRRSAGKPR